MAGGPGRAGEAAGAVDGALDGAVDGALDGAGDAAGAPLAAGEAAGAGEKLARAVRWALTVWAISLSGESSTTLPHSRCTPAMSAGCWLR
jgi:hypothetical protein